MGCTLARGGEAATGAAPSAPADPSTATESDIQSQRRAAEMGAITSAAWGPASRLKLPARRGRCGSLGAHGAGRRWWPQSRSAMSQTGPPLGRRPRLLTSPRRRRGLATWQLQLNFSVASPSEANCGRRTWDPLSPRRHPEVWPRAPAALARRGHQPGVGVLRGAEARAVDTRSRGLSRWPGRRATSLETARHRGFAVPCLGGHIGATCGRASTPPHDQPGGHCGQRGSGPEISAGPLSACHAGEDLPCDQARERSVHATASAWAIRGLPRRLRREGSAADAAELGLAVLVPTRAGETAPPLPPVVVAWAGQANGGPQPASLGTAQPCPTFSKNTAVPGVGGQLANYPARGQGRTGRGWAPGRCLDIACPR